MNRGCPTPPHVQLQVLLSSGDADAAAQVAVAATRRFSQSAEAWSSSLQALVQLGRAEAGQLFQEGLKRVTPKVEPLGCTVTGAALWLDCFCSVAGLPSFKCMYMCAGCSLSE